MQGALSCANVADPFGILTAVVRTSLTQTHIVGPGPFTVFAPTNEAFEKLPAGTVDTLVESRKQGCPYTNTDLSCRSRKA